MTTSTDTTELAFEAATETPDRLLHGKDRANAIAGMRALLDLVEADPALPIDEYAFRINLYPRDAGLDEGDNADAVAWMGTVAGALGVDILDSSGEVPSAKTVIYKVERDFGDHVRYAATHITPEYYARQAARDAAANGGAV